MRGRNTDSHQLLGKRFSELSSKQREEWRRLSGIHPTLAVMERNNDPLTRREYLLNAGYEEEPGAEQELNLPPMIQRLPR